MIRRIWPLKLATPHIELETPVQDALALLTAVGGDVRAGSDGSEELLRASCQTFELAFYHKDDRVTAVWHNDPVGRATWFGRRRKLHLYMRRFTKHGKWELRIDNGWMRFFSTVPTVSVPFTEFVKMFFESMHANVANPYEQI